ncbi:MAG: AMP-binding protein [Hydrogenophilaceae bacterium]|jgi:acyl-CoA synthetase (AMP-forming)/AMP-acid ligase II|nr:AMP-binding protein [Hydrogenophilaceae bacterium]
MHTGLLLEMAADGLAGQTAIGGAEDGLSYAALLSRARAAAARISASGVQNVAFIGENGPAFPIALFAAGLSGRAFAPLNYRLPDADLNRVLARTAPSLAIVDDAMMARLGAAAGVTAISRSAFLDSGAAEQTPEPIDPDIAILLFTSGTTGEPKAAILRHRHVAAYVISTVEFMSAGAEECALVSVPPYHIAGVSAVLTSVYAGRRLVQLPAFSPEGWIETARRERVTHAMVVPTMLGRILEALERDGGALPDLRALSYGGGRMPAPVIERALKRLPHVDFVNAYGLTETSSTISVLTAEDHRAALASADPAVRRRLGSVGRPLPTLELEIRTPDGAPAAPNTPGEIWVRGEQVSGEYVGRKAVREDGWFPTNDCGWLDEAGYLYVDGRLDDVIVRGGENISPGEVEDVLRQHPDVRDVAVIGLPDNEWGERVAAVVVGDADADALRAWTRARLRSTKAPEDIFFRDALPYNDTGKLLRRALKQELAGGG